MTLNVSITRPTSYFVPERDTFSYATRPSLENGDTMCNARGFWYIPCTCRQGLRFPGRD